MISRRHASDYLDQDGLKKRAIAITKQLRQAQSRLFQSLYPDMTSFEQADIYFEPGPGGEYPIVALRSLPCSHFLRGFCTPCAYSARPRPFQDKNRDPYSGLLQQVDNLLSNFNELFHHRAQGELPGYRLRHRRHDRIYMLQLAGESSFFSDHEIPSEYRRQILEKFLHFGNRQKVDWHLMLETRPEDLVKASESGELDRLQPLLETLNVVVNMGFEHENDFLRQVIFVKDLKRDDFLQALSVAKRHGLDPGVFLFAGGFILTPEEALQQVACGLKFLEGQGVFVNVMLPNLQAFTLPDLLYHAGVYELPEPQWLVGLITRLMNYAPQRKDPITPGHWFVGGFVAEPVPSRSIMDHPRKKCSSFLSNRLLQLVHNMMLGGSRQEFEQACEVLWQNPEMKRGSCYLPSLDDRISKFTCDQENWPIQEWCIRTHQALIAAEHQVDNYIIYQSEGTDRTGSLNRFGG